MLPPARISRPLSSWTPPIKARKAWSWFAQAAASGQPYAMAFVDMRMPPGWDGVETTLKLWEVEPDLQIVICSAYSDYSWENLIAKIGQSDRLVILKKPFDNVEVLQLSLALTEKWHLLQQSRLQLETLQRAVTERTAELRTEIAVRKRAEEAAHEAQRAAETASRSKSGFLANMSHEIRTPMNGILGMANLLLETDLNSEQRDFAEILRNSSETLMGILNDILDFSKIEAGRLTLETTDFDLWEVVESATELHAARAAQKKLELITQIGEEVPTLLRGDPLRLRQVLLNLVGNAIKFTSSGEVFLDVSLERQDDTTANVRFEVHDSGIGIAEDVIPNLFQPFTQADDSTTRRFGGTGLGLAISRRIVEAMGGSVSIRSTIGKGSVFYFTVSFLKYAAAEKNHDAERTSLKGLRALIVDDNDTNRKVLHHQLARWGVANLAVADGPAALEALRATDTSGNAYDVVLLDMQMPEMDGLMVAEAIRIAEFSKSPPTGHADLDGRPAQLRRTSPPRSGRLSDQARQTFSTDPLPDFRHSRSTAGGQSGDGARQPPTSDCTAGTRAVRRRARAGRDPHRRRQCREPESRTASIEENGVVRRSRRRRTRRVACLAPEALPHRADGLPDAADGRF